MGMKPLESKTSISKKHFPDILNHQLGLVAEISMSTLFQNPAENPAWYRVKQLHFSRITCSIRQNLGM